MRRNPGKLHRSLRRDGLRLRAGFSRNPRSREEAAGAEEFGVEKSGAGGSAQQVVREQRELDVEYRAVANPADGGGHAVARIDGAPPSPPALPLPYPHHDLP